MLDLFDQVIFLFIQLAKGRKTKERMGWDEEYMVSRYLLFIIVHHFGSSNLI